MVWHLSSIQIEHWHFLKIRGAGEFWWAFPGICTVWCCGVWWCHGPQDLTQAEGFSQGSSATQWLLWNTETVPTCSRMGIQALWCWIYRAKVGINWYWCSARRLSRASSRGTGSVLCFEVPEAICSSRGVVGQGRRMLSWEVGHDPSLHRDCYIPPAPR